MRNLSKMITVFVAVCFIGMLSGCATLLSQKSKSVSMEASVTAKVYVDGAYQGQTPLTLNLSNNKDHTVEFRSVGYQSRVYKINRNLNGMWVVLDIVTSTALLIPIVVDLITGDWFELDTDHINMELTE